MMYKVGFIQISYCLRDNLTSSENYVILQITWFTCLSFCSQWGGVCLHWVCLKGGSLPTGGGRLGRPLWSRKTGGMHPTGMLSCFVLKLLLKYEMLNPAWLRVIRNSKFMAYLIKTTVISKDIHVKSEKSLTKFIDRDGVWALKHAYL